MDYDEKVSKYWPEFAQKGKENVTLKQLISHSVSDLVVSLFYMFTHVMV